MERRKQVKGVFFQRFDFHIFAQRAQKIWNGATPRSNASVFNPQENQRQRFENNRVAFADYLERARKREELIERIEAYLKELQISKKTFEDVAVSKNMITRYKGNLFTNIAPPTAADNYKFSISANTDWKGENIIEF